MTTKKIVNRKKKQMSISLPDDLMLRVEEESKKHGFSKSTIVHMAVKTYFEGQDALQAMRYIKKEENKES